MCEAEQLFCFLLQQDTLQLWDGKSVRGDARQVFLFDHQIIIASTADNDGFFEYQTGIKVNFDL